MGCAQRPRVGPISTGSAASGSSELGVCLRAWEWAAASCWLWCGPDSSSTLRGGRDSAGGCRQRFRPLPPTPIPQSGVLEKLLLVLEKELRNSQKPEGWLFHSWELELGHGRGT